MDPNFFGLNADPFAKPDHAEFSGDLDDNAGLTTELQAGLKAPHGITLLIGDTGAGKSAFIRGFLAQLSDTYVTAYLPSAGPGLRHLLTETIEQLGGTIPQGAQEEALIDTLKSLAKARAEHDRSTLIVLDEAHDLPAKTIERLGKLFGSDPAEPSRLHLTLVGRAELLDRMNAANDRSILKHLVQVCRMEPMGPEEAFRYIADRIQKVGGIVDQIFTQDALKLVVQQSYGSPARIDALCSAAMERAAKKGRAEVDADAVTGAAAGDEAGTDGDAVTIEKEPNTPTYFFHDDQDDRGEEDVAPTAASASAAEMPPQRAQPAGGTSRRRLLFWAAGAIAVLAAFAATMTDRSTPTIPIAGRQADTIAKNDGGPAAVRKGGGDKAPKKKAGSAAESVPADGDKVPKLVAKRAAAAASAAQGQVGKAAPAGQPADPRPSFPAPEIPTAPAAAAGAASAPKTPNAGFPTSIPGPPAAATAGAPAAIAGGAAVKPEDPVVKPATDEPATPTPAAAPAAVGAPVAAKPTIPPTRTPAAAAVKPAAAPAPKVVAPPAAVASAARSVPGGLFTVQIGAFSSRANAEAVLAKARGTAKDGRIVASTAGGKPIFRVVAGSFSSPAEANQHAAALRANGYSTFVRKLD
jgi:type II secretory pathway predicted ATPase ExeA/cell division septation protein DedD